MKSRERILAALRAQPMAGPALPELWQNLDRRHGPPAPLAGPSTVAPGPANLSDRYGVSLTAAGGTALPAPDLTAVAVMLTLLCEEGRLTRVASLVPEITALPGRTMVDVSQVNDPHDLIDIDLAVVPGRFAVAENGAVWVSGADLRQRAVCFVCEHLALVVPADAIVGNMHQAYERLSLDLDVSGHGAGVADSFGVFISGPSKTADIEQALVLGAHGPRSLVVFLVAPPPATTI